jgi:pimeloyl-ACP methyl ester carboxylesterase
MADSSMWGRDQQGNTKLDSSVGFKLIAFDCRGHGKSDKPHDPKQYGVELAADVVRLLDHLHLDKAHLVGYSSGAFIAGKVAATYPDRVLSVVYAGQAPVIAEVMKPGDFSEVESFARAVESGDLASYLIDITPADRPKPTREQAEAVAKYLYGGKDVEALAICGQSFPELAVTITDLKKSQAPILFIRGENESQHVKSKIKTARELLGRGEIKVIPGGDHITTLIQPEFTTSLLDFLRHGHLQ